MLFQSRQQTVLIIDPRQASSRTLQASLADHGYRVAIFESLPEAKHWLAEHQPSVVLLDALPDPIVALKTIREMCEHVAVVRPLIVLLDVGLSDVKQARKLLAVGADDVIFKPIPTEALLHRLDVHLHYHRTLAQLRSRNELLTRLAAFDELTRLFNRRSFLEALSASLERGAKKNMPFALLLIDIDHFKRINDSFGHHVGDAALRELAHRLSAPLRQDDVIGRYGGEEFCALIHNVSLEQALTVANRLRQSVSAAPIIAEGRVIPVTASVGMAWIPGKRTASNDELLRCADSALYEAKQTGRNKVVVRDLDKMRAGDCDIRQVMTPDPTSDSSPGRR